MGRLDADDGELAARFRSMDEASRRRFACAMVRFALKECDPPVALPPTAEQLLGKGGIATRPQLAELDRRAASSGGVSDEGRIRRARRSPPPATRSRRSRARPRRRSTRPCTPAARSRRARGGPPQAALGRG